MRTELQPQMMTKATMSYGTQIPSDKKSLSQPVIPGSDDVVKGGSAQASQKNSAVNTNSIQNSTALAKQDSYIPSEPNPKKAGYDKPSVKPDMVTINRLKEESNRVYNSMKEAVKQMLEKQGMTFQEIDSNSPESTKTSSQVSASEDTPKNAQAVAASLIGEGGALSPEKLSDTILEFAKAISGEDKSKLQVLRSAIEEGFNEAKKTLGGELPEISKKTYELIQQKLDAWEKSSSDVIANDSVKSGNGILSNV